MAILANGLQAEPRRSSTPIGLYEPCPTSYQASIIRTLEEFSSLARPWNDFLNVCGENSITLRHEWLNLYLQMFPPHELLIIVVRDTQNHLVAVAPFQIARNPSGLLCRMLRRLQFIGTSPEVYDSMKLVIHPNADKTYASRLIGDLLIQNRSRWDVADLRYLDSEEQVNFLNDHLKTCLKQAQITQPMSIPYIELPDDWDEYRTKLRKKKYQNDLKRVQNHIRQDFKPPGAQLIVHHPNEESARNLEKFLNFHKDYWMTRRSRTEYHRHPKLLEFYRTIHQQFSESHASNKPVFEFSSLVFEDRPVSYHFDIQTQIGCMGYLSCYNQDARKYRPGILHIEALIERTHQLGRRRFEFGRGDEHYKNQWHIQKRPLWNLLAFRTTLAKLCWHGDIQLKDMYANGQNTHGTSEHTPDPQAQTAG